jgi:hypothetical protein
MLSVEPFEHISIYTEGLEVAESANFVTVGEGVIVYNGTPHELEAITFEKVEDENHPVYYQLSIIDNNGVLDYDLERTVITPRHIPSHSGGSLIHVILSFMLEVNGETNGEVQPVIRIGGEETGEEAEIITT